jgi:hypothetical protein
MLDKLKLLYPSTDEQVLSLLMENAQSFFINYCNLAEFPNTAESILLKMVSEDINKLYSEGYASESAGGNSVGYLTDYSAPIYKQLNKFKRIRTVE